MTTIACKDGILAADTLATWGNYRDGSAAKIAQRGPVLAAASGNLPDCKAFLDWFRSGMIGDAPKMKEGEDGATGLIFTPDGRCLTRIGAGWEYTSGEFYAAGSGWQYAKGAMAMGADAEEAVRIAMAHDTKTGGEIIVLRRAEP